MGVHLSAKKNELIMKVYLFVALFSFITIFSSAHAELVCRDSIVNFDQLENISESIDLSMIVENKSNVDLVLLGYFGSLCGVKDLAENFCFRGYDKEASYQAFDYFRRIYSYNRNVHLNFVVFPDVEHNRIELNFTIKNEQQILELKRCPKD